MNNQNNLRRHARRMAMTALYAAECTGYDIDEVLKLMQQLREDWQEIPEFTRKLVNTVADHEDEIEEKIVSILENWRLDRVASVEKALLKLGCTEILYFADIPPRVTINEYIELAKIYANANAPAFINGILDRLVQVQQKTDFKATR